MARNVILTAVTAIALLSGQAMAAAGAFLLATGNVQVRDAGGALRAAKPGMEINSGETILTQNGRAQVRFTDSGHISLQPGTEFKIADYRFQEASQQEESAFFGLIKGSVRAITGLVGRRAKANYRMDTAVATIGIRGTEFQATLCASSCKEPDGLYVHTGEGIVFVKNALGEVDVGRGQTAFVASAQSAPQRTSAGPSLSNAPQAAQPPVMPGVTEPGFQPGTITTTNSLGQVTPLTLSSGGIAGVASGSGSITFEGQTYSGTGGVGQASSGAGKNTTSTIVGAYINGSQVNGFVASDAGAFASIYFSSVLDAASSGELYWGRWSGGNATLYAGLNGTNASATISLPTTASLHYVLGTSVPTIPTTGSATYYFVGGTPSTNSSGAVVGSGIIAGSGTNLSKVTANFSSNYVSANLYFAGGGPVTTTMLMDSRNRASFSSGCGTVTCGNVSGSVGGISLSGSNSRVAGFFAGTGSPTGVGLSYNLNNVVGVGAFR